ncbi:trissin receptor-like isoform X2 [Mytilus edulis]|uniref:trissin receptor-like isoform X2 n=1 Tax=Mytilus edulis TaxID=6550 RepID=UPI0039EEA500
MAENESLYGDSFNGTSSSVPTSFFDDMFTKVVFICAYSTVFALCVFGNIMVLFAIVKSARLRSLTNFFLANLAVADFWIGVFCVLPNLSTFFSQKWILGRAMCKIYYFVWNMSYTASIVILTAIATERYIAIRFPLRARRCITQKRLFLVQAIIWMIAAVYGTPYLFIFDLYEMPGMDGEITYYCFPDYSRINMKALVTANFIIWYVIPLGLMSYMYCRIGISLWKVSKKPRTPKPPKPVEIPAEDSYYTTSSSEGQGRKRSLRMHKMSSVCNHKEQRDKCLYCKPSNQRNSLKESTKRCSCEKVESERSSASSSNMVDINTNHSRFNCNNVAFVEYKTRETKNVPKLRVYFNTEQTRMNSIRAVRSRRRVIRLLVAVVISFTVCVLPHHIRILLLFWKVPMYDLERVLSPVSFLILYLNSALNPILYALFSANFRKSFKESFPCRRRRRPLPFFIPDTRSGSF